MTSALGYSIYGSSLLGKLKATFSKIKTFSPAKQNLFSLRLLSHLGISIAYFATQRL